MTPLDLFKKAVSFLQLFDDDGNPIDVVERLKPAVPDMVNACIVYADKLNKLKTGLNISPSRVDSINTAITCDDMIADTVMTFKLTSFAAQRFDSKLADIFDYKAGVFYDYIKKSIPASVSSTTEVH